MHALNYKIKPKMAIETRTKDKILIRFLKNKLVVNPCKRIIQ